jgi:putative tricarboxylic transport membrane protein
LLLSYIGAFAESNAFGDVVVMLAFGALGWVMVQADWPRPPLLLGLVLGELAEQNLFLSIDNYDLDWLKFPSVIALFALTVLGTFYPLFQRWREKRNKPRYKQFAETVAIHPREAGSVSIWFSIFSLLVVVLFAWALWQSWDWALRPGLFPWVVGFLGLPLAILQLNYDIIGTVKAIGHGRTKGRDQEVARVARETVKISAWIMGYFIAVWLLGFSIAIVVTTVLYLKLAKERWLITLVLTFFTWATFYALFVYLLHVPFPEGQLFAWFQ